MSQAALTTARRSQVPKWDGVVVAEWEGGSRNEGGFWQTVTVCLAEREGSGNKVGIMM